VAFAGASAGLRDNSGTVACALGTLAAGASQTATIVAPAEPGTATNAATVSSTTADADTSNNGATASSKVNTACTSTQTGGRITGPFTIPAGTFLCLAGTSTTGQITLAPGAGLTTTGGAAGGGIIADGAQFVTVCGSTVTGTVSIKNSTLMVRLGDDDIGCAGKAIGGSLTATGNLAASRSTPLDRRYHHDQQQPGRLRVRRRSARDRRQPHHRRPPLPGQHPRCDERQPPEHHDRPVRRPLDAVQVGVQLAADLRR
jgi:hypothetical protein